MNHETAKAPRLFYWEDAESSWVPVTEEMQIAFEQTFSIEDIAPNGEIELRFKRMDMTDEEFDSLPEG